MTNMDNLEFYQAVLTSQSIAEQPNFKGTFASAVEIRDYIAKNKMDKNSFLVNVSGEFTLRQKKGANG